MKAEDASRGLQIPRFNTSGLQIRWNENGYKLIVKLKIMSFFLQR